jgi:hypothetical protein
MISILRMLFTSIAQYNVAGAVSDTMGTKPAPDETPDYSSHFYDLFVNSSRILCFCALQ